MTNLLDNSFAERNNPRPGQKSYLHLSDLLLALKQYSTSEKIRVLDYGCRTSPYRSLFPNAEYLRADFPDVGDVDYVISPEGTVDAPSAQFDCVLSTQVLAHVRDPQVYLGECKRLLRRHGVLLLSTHGTYWDAPSPTDYWRWTAAGLRVELGRAGFEVVKMQKATTGGRAALCVLDRHIERISGSRKYLVGTLLWLLKRAVATRRQGFHVWCDKYLAHCRLVEVSNADSGFYIALVTQARKA
jgi:SAM-dependent methyltransferase